MYSLRNSVLCAVACATAAFGANPPPATALKGVELPKDEKSFLERLHHINQMEVELGQLAQTKAQSQEVKDYGQMMVTDHKQADEQLMAFAKQNNMKLGEPKAMNDAEKKVMEAHKADAAELKSIEGAPFDSTYMAMMVTGHDAAIMKIMAGQSQFTKSAQLTTGLLPKLSEHRDQAYKILGSLKPNTQGVGGSGSDMGTTGSQPGATEKQPSGTKNPKK